VRGVTLAGNIDETRDENRGFSVHPIVLQIGDEDAIREVKKKFFNLLESIGEDARQLSEFIVEERNLIREICKHLRMIFSGLGLSVSLPPDLLSDFFDCREVVLNAQGHLILIDVEGNVESRSLEKYPPEVVLAVLWGLVPKLRETFTDRIKKVYARISLFERIHEEFRGIDRAIEAYRSRDLENSVENHQRSLGTVILQRDKMEKSG